MSAVINRDFVQKSSPLELLQETATQLATASQAVTASVPEASDIRAKVLEPLARSLPEVFGAQFEIDGPARLIDQLILAGERHANRSGGAASIDKLGPLFKGYFRALRSQQKLQALLKPLDSIVHKMRDLLTGIRIGGTQGASNFNELLASLLKEDPTAVEAAKEAKLDLTAEGLANYFTT
ncbi:MAG: hypothetical protein OXU45_01820 [Candidatus Melainabacteria bacterium]|nr:hypothetical protein [Candidatus Melainabacteria bacterium]